ncbi:glycoside hydrolase family 5 [Paenibacillus curdlanolyticus YK9]|uniref:Endoglucanase n=1 Tax=Paenibacillus curdlanolyticus YK9 TaxID=717606 RepID=E0IFA3_9BACL|nr:cellulase family glycosylhydrolase [Paenibacillus curdlanolyticus]EFM08879.1 glycoside hydrolase family 5 [Paenibacillus curdlanolyticus YK9]
MTTATATFKRWSMVLLAAALACSLLTIVGARKTEAAALGYYHTSGSRIVDAGGNPAIFNGLNWFGFETANYSPHGLWSYSLNSVMDQIKAHGYNLIRLPYSNQMFDAGSMPTSLNTTTNPDLLGLTPIQLMDRVVQAAGERGIQIILDRHRPDSGGQSELWYTAQYSEQRWINDWVMLAQRYANNPTVIGADLHNEPHGTASWGTGVAATDWRLAAERAGNAILAANPNWLILVEGVSSNVQGESSNYWWGGNLKGARNYPVRLDVPNRLVYSPHDYGPGVATQTWFSDPAFPNNMPALWDSYWGYISKENIAPILIGEFGGRGVDLTTTEGVWQNKLVDYIKTNDLYWTYWSLNPNSGDTGGLLLDDWLTWNSPKQAMLDRIMKPLGTANPPGPTVPAAPATLAATAGNAQVVLNWTASTSAASYNVKRATSSGGPYTTVATGVTGTTYTNTGLTNGTAYYYVVSAVNSAGESANSAQASATPTSGSTPPTPSGSLIVQYKVNNANATDNMINATLNIKNTGTSAVSLSTLKLRYYLTKDSASAGLSMWTDYAQVGSSNVSGTFAAVSPAKTNADTYVELSFSAAAGSIAAGGQSGDIQIRIAKSDWSNFNEANDYSYNGAQTAYADWSKVTLYQSGSLVWGLEP